MKNFSDLSEQEILALAITSEDDLIANLRSQIEALNAMTFSDGEWERFFRERIAGERDGVVAGRDGDDARLALRRRQAAEDLVPHRLLAHPVDERLDDAEVDVRFEQRQPDLAQRGVDGRFGEACLTPERPEDPLQTLTQRLQHDVPPPGRPSSGRSQGTRRP